MRDIFIGGSVAGLIGGIIGIAFSHSLFLLGLTPISSLHLAAALVLPEMFVLTTGGVFISLVTHLIVASVFGVALILILYYTGKDYYIFKGIASGAFACLVLHSYLLPLVRPDLEIRHSTSAAITMITTHSIIGLVAAFIIAKYSKINTAS